MLREMLPFSLVPWLALGCGGSVIESDPSGGSGGAGGGSGSGGAPADAAVDAAGTGGGPMDAAMRCASNQDCSATEWCDFEPAEPGECSSPIGAGTCRLRPATCPKNAEVCPGACACNGVWYCDGCDAHQAGWSTTSDNLWCAPMDGGGGTCNPGFCKEMTASCEDPDYVPVGSMGCTGPSGNDGFCCLPRCGGFEGAACGPGQYCDFLSGPACGGLDGAGACMLAPTACDADCPGVCGCDGQFYCNECNAQQAGTGVSDSDACKEDFWSNLEGIWLIGWSGGMNHFSWVRFVANDPMAGDALFNPGEDVGSNMPLWPCSGKGSWMATAKPDTVQLMFPPNCSLQTEVLSFISLGPTGGYPPGAILSARIESLSTPSPLEGYKFTPAQCEPDMSSCVDPFGY